MSVVVDRVVLRAAAARRLPPWTLDLGAGTHAMVLTEPDVALELARIVAGIEEPKRGRVFVGQEEPYRSPALRARLAVHCLRDFAALGHVSAQDFMSMVQAHRARHGVATAEPLGLIDSARLALPLARLSPQERSELELELALGIEKPPLVWLSQPPRPERDEINKRLVQRATEGATVVVVVRTDREAALWGDQRLPRAPASSRDETTIQLVVERPREVAAALQHELVVLGTELDPDRPNVLLVHGADDVALRQACGAAVVARRCELSEMVTLRSRGRTASQTSVRAGGGGT